MLREGSESGYSSRLEGLLPGKTRRQIRDKVTMLREKGLLPTRHPEGSLEDTPDEDEHPREVTMDAPPPLIEEVEVPQEDLLEHFDLWSGNPHGDWLDREHDHPLAKELAVVWTECESPSAEWMDGFLERVVASLGESDGRNTQRKRKAGSRRGNSKKVRYADTQEIFKKCPSRLGEMVRQDRLGDLLRESEVVCPLVEAIKQLYGEIWGLTGDSSLALGVDGIGGKFTPITTADVRKRLKRMKPHGAPGPDGLRKEDLLGVPGICDLLAGFFNLVLFKEEYPKA